MRKLLFVLVGSLAMACGDRSDRPGGREAAAEDEVEAESDDAAYPLLELDSVDKSEVDSVSSSEKARDEQVDL